MNSITLPEGHKWHSVPSGDSCIESFECPDCGQIIDYEYQAEGGCLLLDSDDLEDCEAES